MDSSKYDSCLEAVRKLALANERIAIHASLVDIFTEAARAHPKTIVELGVSGLALANKVLAMVAEMNNSWFYSCDIADFSRVCSYPRWSFYLSDDVKFADFYMGSHVDLLFVDTNELYEHVKDEIRAWFPKLSVDATVMFRCTNLQKTLHYPSGRTTGLGWDNHRGVIRAIEDTLHIEWDETLPFEGKLGAWEVKHWPWGAGLTVLKASRA